VEVRLRCSSSHPKPERPSLQVMAVVVVKDVVVIVAFALNMELIRLVGSSGADRVVLLCNG
jgi:hypothetical protein